MPPTDENMVSEHMDEELHGGDSPVPNSIGMAELMGGYKAVDAAKVQALASDCDDGDMVFMNISPTQFKTIVEELSNNDFTWAPRKPAAAPARTNVRHIPVTKFCFSSVSLYG